MPAIWNVGNTQGYNDKKISSKLTFEEGETFRGRIVGKGEGDSVLIKMIDGWQFSADLLDESASQGQQVVQFKVEGFEEGKIKLKIINDLQTKNETVEDDLIKDFINKEGISKEDVAILKSMIKFNLPLSKSNIDFVKSVFNLNEKLDNTIEVEEFINNYISGKGIDPKMPEALNIRNTLNEFFSAFKTMNQDDILLFLENNIDINKENIDSYNKLFKGDITVKEYFDNVAKEFENLNLEKPTTSNKAENSILTNKEVSLDAKEENEVIKYSQKQTMGLRVYDNTTASKNRVSLLSLLKSMNGGEANLTRDTVRDILVDNKDLFKGLELKEAFSKLDNISEKEIQNIFKELSRSGTITKEGIENAIKQLFGKEIKLSEGEIAKLKDIINISDNKSDSQISDNKGDSILKSDAQFSSSIIKDSKSAEKTLMANNAKITSSTIVKNELDNKVNNMKDILKDILSHSQELANKSLEGKVAEFIKSNINDFKLFNALSNEYYYLDVPISRENKDYPCKLIIKDDRKGNKKIDSSNVKMVVAVKTVNMGTVDAYIKVLNNSLNVDIKCIDKYVKFLSKGTKQLTEKLNELGYIVNVNVIEKVEEVGLTTCREFFDSGSNSALDTKV